MQTLENEPPRKQDSTQSEGEFLKDSSRGKSQPMAKGHREKHGDFRTVKRTSKQKRQRERERESTNPMTRTIRSSRCVSSNEQSYGHPRGQHRRGTLANKSEDPKIPHQLKGCPRANNLAESFPVWRLEVKKTRTNSKKHCGSEYLATGLMKAGSHKKHSRPWEWRTSAQVVNTLIK